MAINPISRKSQLTPLEPAQFVSANTRKALNGENRMSSNKYATQSKKVFILKWCNFQPQTFFAAKNDSFLQHHFCMYVLLCYNLSLLCKGNKRQMITKLFEKATFTTFLLSAIISFIGLVAGFFAKHGNWELPLNEWVQIGLIGSLFCLFLFLIFFV